MRRFSLGFALLVLLQLGVSAPQSPVDSKPSTATSKTSKPQKSLAAVATPQALGDQIVKFFERKTGKDLMTEKAGKAPGAGSAVSHAVSAKPSVRTATVTPLKPGYVPPPPTPRASVPQIRQELQKIFELNKKIKNLQGGRSVQLQRVQDQARIHQKILVQLEASQKQAEGQNASEKMPFVSQEKLRIIHEETQRNAQALEALKELPAEAVSSSVKKVKSIAS